MAVSVNLSRNTKVYYTTQFDVTGYGDHNTQEIQVMNGYTFSQGTDQQTIQITEAGATPNRGQRSFNTKLNPVDWKFTTYVRPKRQVSQTAITSSASPAVTYYTVGGVIVSAEALVTAAAGPTASGLLWNVTGYTGNSTVCNTLTMAHKNSATVFRIAVPPTHVGATLTGTGTFAAATTLVTCGESVLWNALVSPQTLYGGGVAQPWSVATTGATLVATASNAHQLAPFALIFKIDNTYYKVSGCAINSADVNFGIDQIAQIAWAGFGTAYTSFDTSTAGATQLSSLTAADSTAYFITNKLSTVSLGTGLRAAATGTSGTVNSTATPIYSVPITGGSLSINNNLNYLTPEMVGVVNVPIGYFTGTRAVSGNLTAYLRAGGTTETSDLLTAVLTGAATAADNKYSMVLSMGGAANSTHVEFPMDGCMLQIPSVDVQDVVSTTINFTAQGSTGTHPNGTYDITSANEFGVVYKSA